METPKMDDTITSNTLSENDQTTDETTELQNRLAEVYAVQRQTKRELASEQRTLMTLQEELRETQRTIDDDRFKILVLQQEQTFTAKQIKDALSNDLKRYEDILKYRQPDLLTYCCQLFNTKDCLQAITAIRDCKYHIQLAESLITSRYASVLSERTIFTGSSTCCVGGGVSGLPSFDQLAATSSGTVGPTSGPVALLSSSRMPVGVTTRATSRDGTVTSRSKLRKLSLQVRDNNSWSTGGTRRSEADNRGGGSVGGSASGSNSDVVRIEIRERESMSRFNFRELKPITITRVKTTKK